MNAKLVSAITPVAAFALNLACPAIPAWAWSALIGAILGGNITLAHLTEFMAAHGVKIYPPKDIQTPDAKPVEGTNLVSGGFHDQGQKSM